MDFYHQTDEVCIMTCDIIGEIHGPDGGELYYDGLPTTNFSVNFQKLPFTVMFLQDFQTPSIDVGVVQRATPYVDVQEIGEKIIFGDFTMTFLVDKYLKNYREIYTWMRRMTVNGTVVGDTDNPVISINNKQMIRLVEAWPKSLSTLNFKSNESDVIYITATATFNMDYLEFIDQPFDKLT